MKIVKSISAVVLAILVLVSSTSFMVGLHLCMGRVQGVAIFTKADDCGMMQSKPSCNLELKAACCQDEAIIHNADDFNTTSSDFHFSVASLDISIPHVVLAEVIPSAHSAQIRRNNYDPPLPDDNITVEHQVFLI